MYFCNGNCKRKLETYRKRYVFSKFKRTVWIIVQVVRVPSGHGNPGNWGILKIVWILRASQGKWTCLSGKLRAGFYFILFFLSIYLYPIVNNLKGMRERIKK